jgi:hypothetical protein
MALKRTGNFFTIHGHCKDETVSVEYRAWLNMRSRCYNPTYIHYHRYGERGIKVCNRWRNSFPNFLADMGKRPSPAHSLDRIDNDKSYSPENCQWATRKEQQRNRHDNALVEWNGEIKGMSDWADLWGMARQTLYERIVRRKWPPERWNEPVRLTGK